MATLTDAKWDALGAQGFTGSISDRTLQWLVAGSVAPLPKSISDAWKNMLTNRIFPAGNYQRNDSWYVYLGTLGFAGSLNDREMAFWLSGGVLGPPITPP